jgi:hypothetical protein
VVATEEAREAQDVVEASRGTRIVARKFVLELFPG